MKRKTVHLLSALIMSMCVILGLLNPVVLNADDSFTITYHAGDGEFDGGGSENAMSYNVTGVPGVKYSHTQNVDDTGKKNSNYGNRWANANITGTDRGNTSKAHVVTIPNATELTVEFYFNGESTSYDWSSVWAGSHPDYTAASNYDSTGKVTTANGAPNNTNKYGGYSMSGVTFGTYTVNGNTLTNVGHVTFKIPGDTVTFSFKSDGSGYGGGYGYYAIVKATTTIDLTDGSYKEPVPEDDSLEFVCWTDSSTGSGGNYYTEDDVDRLAKNMQSIDLYPVYKKKEIKIHFLPGTNGHFSDHADENVLTYDPQYGIVNNQVKITSKTLTSGTYKEPQPDNSNYTFVRWGENEDGTGATCITSSNYANTVDNGEDVYLYPEYRKKELSVRFHTGDGGEFSDGSGENVMTYAVQYSIVNNKVKASTHTLSSGEYKEPTPADEHRSFVGWSDTAETGGNCYTEETFEALLEQGEDVNLYADYRHDTLSITFHLKPEGAFPDGTAENVMTYSVQYNITNNKVTVGNCELISGEYKEPVHVSEEMKFVQWGTDESGLGSVCLTEENITHAIKDGTDADLYPNYRKAFVRIRFHVSNGHFSDGSDTNVLKYNLDYRKVNNYMNVYRGSLVEGKYEEPVHNNPDYSFTKWSIPDSVMATALDDKDPVAIFELTRFPIRFHAGDGGEFDDGSKTNTAYYIASYSRDGGTFISSSPEPNGNYKEPLAYDVDGNKYNFIGWTTVEGTTSAIDISKIKPKEEGVDVYAVYRNDKKISGTFGCPFSLSFDGDLVIGKDGETCTLPNTNNMGSSSWPWYSFRNDVKTVTVKGTVNFANSSMRNFMNSLPNATKIDLTGLDTSNITDFGYAFSGCSSMQEIIFGDKFNTSSGQNMESMFYNCNSLTSIDEDAFDTSNVYTVDSMFVNCGSLKKLDIRNWDFKNIDYVSRMFSGCSGLEEILLGRKDLRSVKYFESVFQSCKSLKELDLSGLMFSENLQYIGSAFHSCENLKTIYVDEDWPVPPSISTAQNAFNYDKNLSGGEGTMIGLSGVTTAEYARIDDLDNGRPGYFTKKGANNPIGTIPDGAAVYQSSPEDWKQLSDDTWVYEFNVFDDTIPYYLYENPMGGYTSDMGDEGYKIINNDPSNPTKQGKITNRSQENMGDLKITKTVSGVTTQKRFNFTLTLSGPAVKEGSQIIDDVLFNNGVARFSLAGGETKTIHDLPYGTTYTVTETPDPSFSSSGENAEGTVNSEETTVSFLNTYIEPPVSPVNIEIEKAVANAIDVDPDTEYQFDITINGLASEFEYSLSNGQSFTSTADGEAAVTVRLKSGESVIIQNIPAGASYKISEKGGDYLGAYEITDANGINSIVQPADYASSKNTDLATALETADEGEAIKVLFTNTYEDYADLKVTKIIDADPEDIDEKEKFEFTIVFENMKPDSSFNSSVGKVTADGDGRAEKTFYLSHGEIADFSEIPVGVSYVITEGASAYAAAFELTDANDNGHFTTPSKENTNDNTPLSTDKEYVNRGENVTATYTNRSKGVGDLTVKKLVTGNFGSKNKQFNFTITLKSGSMPLKGTFEFTGSKDGFLTLDRQGRATFTLAHNENIVIKNIPAGAAYTVTEEDYSKDGYSVQKEHDTGSIDTISTNNRVTFTNSNNGRIPTGTQVMNNAVPLLFIPFIAAMLIYFAKKRRHMYEK